MRFPRWALALLVLACLAGAAALFWADARDDEQAPPATSTTEDELAESELQVPEDSGDDGRRGEQGRDRLEQGEGPGAGEVQDPADAEADDGNADADADEPLPAVFENLAGRRIAVVPASLAVKDDPDRLVAIGGLKVPCAAAGDPRRLGRELAARTELAEVLERAGARLVTTDPAKPGCVDARVRLLEGAELALVVRVVSRGPRVLAGRPATNATPASKRASAAFAAELAAALPFGTPATADAAARTRLAESAAIDIEGGARVAFVELGDDGDFRAEAMVIARAMALTLSRAGSQGT